ncbi:MAG: hypothetical protein DSZ33_00105 [Gammaproteobacteria bacterium]|nr:MAG: hypothetical protein DSZ33_00105 [Gammaproteobacteria bacterium]
MSNILTVMIENQSVIEYDRDIPLPARQQEYLDRMDAQMDGGFAVGEEWVAQPDPIQRAEFVSATLFQALKDNNEGLISASTAYLANRFPELKQVKSSDTGGDGENSIRLVFDEEAGDQVAVSFDGESGRSVH